jgi:general secretion pathway protein G
MMLPAPLLKHSYHERKKAKDKILREAEAVRTAAFPANTQFGRQPATIVILLVILLLAGAALLSRLGPTRPASTAMSREMIAREQLQVLQIALERFRIDCSRFPTREEGLRALVLDPGAPGWSGPYVNIVKPDPWHTPFEYQPAGDSILLRSRGPDRKADTPDDLRPEPPSAEEIAR